MNETKIKRKNHEAAEADRGVVTGAGTGSRPNDHEHNLYLNLKNTERSVQKRVHDERQPGKGQGALAGGRVSKPPLIKEY